MSPENRAKQFAPFAAQGTPLPPTVAPAARRSVAQEQAEKIDRVLRTAEYGRMLTVTYYTNGGYRRQTGHLTRLEPAGQWLALDGKRIPFADLLDLETDSSLPE